MNYLHSVFEEIQRRFSFAQKQKGKHMNDNDKKLEQSMRDFQKAKKAPEDDWTALLRDAVRLLNELAEATKNVLPAREEAEDSEDVDGIVLLADPGRGMKLVDQYEAEEEILFSEKATGFVTHHITEELMVVYAKESMHINIDGSVLVNGPLYVMRPEEDCEEDAADLSAVDFCEAMKYLCRHTVPITRKSGTGLGFLLKKED